MNRAGDGPRLSVIGAGYLGVTHAVCMAELGYPVTVLDIDAARIAQLSEARLPFFEPGLAELLRRHAGTSRLRFTASYAEAARAADVHFVCVGTPESADGSLDTGAVEAAVTSLAPHLDQPVLVVGKSTVPVGTAAPLAERLRELAPGSGVELAWNPEFLREGFAVQDTLRPDRLVFGVAGPTGEQRLREVYRPAIDAGAPVVVTDLATAELVKVAANAFLATKISFINAISDICDATGADVTQLADAIGHDPRIGRRFLSAGLGYGGGCLPKDVRGFIAQSEQLGAPDTAELLRQVDQVNLARRGRAARLAAELLADAGPEPVVAVLGAAFKPDSDDIRDSPALEVAAAIRADGAQVRVYDPAAGRSAAARYPQLSIAGSLADAVTGADLVLLLTEWDEFRRMRPDQLGGLVRRRYLMDARNVLDRDQWRAAGWRVHSPGRP